MFDPTLIWVGGFIFACGIAVLIYKSFQNDNDNSWDQATSIADEGPLYANYQNEAKTPYESFKNTVPLNDFPPGTKVTVAPKTKKTAKRTKLTGRKTKKKKSSK